MAKKNLEKEVAVSPSTAMNCSTARDDDCFASPVKKSISVKLKIKIGGKIQPLPIDENEIVYYE